MARASKHRIALDEWNFRVWATGGTDCSDPARVETCKNQVQVPVIGASTEGGDDYEPLGGMPAGDPLGLQTVYCDYGDVTRLRCEIWVTAALIEGADGQHLN
ncbi:hypothetical protein [Nocardia farcinica]|uniref:hypothetical protein n=1 Tax=Nocardia farcinica TaxID=37329 RepID=UPI0005A03EC8|nr:hypothetical protein [Nocardia farcinica]MBF6185987.1 hypothetical protein [Nocardia farcinica]MBF6256466.1 hypothetical protein [Nocardia farcinica]MBF6382519.1 hypothetical protein [Nocardia farcinica]MBF6408816.1 hypothetical protein [Nocardia farcinica]